MTKLPIHLSRVQRQRLLQALNTPTLYDTATGRDTLLIDLHDTVAPTVARAGGKWADLAAIVEAAERWGHLPDGTPALWVLIDAATTALAGSDSARTLTALRTELTAPALRASELAPPPVAATPAPPDLLGLRSRHPDGLRSRRPAALPAESGAARAGNLVPNSNVIRYSHPARDRNRRGHADGRGEAAGPSRAAIHPGYDPAGPKWQCLWPGLQP